MHVRTVDVAGTSLCVRSWGEPHGIPFVFWHSLGFGGNGSFLDVATPALVEAGFAPVALDGPGFGNSEPFDRDGYAVDRLVELLWALIDETVDRRPLVLAGHSWGGTVAITAAARRPDQVSALALLDSGHIDYADWPDANPEATFEELIAELEAEEFPTTWDELVSILTGENLAQRWSLEAWRNGFDVDESGALRLKVSLETLAAARMGLMRARASEAWPTVAAAAIPTLVLLATEPEALREPNTAAAERMRAVFPAAELRPVEGIRHAVFADLGAEAGVLIADWLQEAGIAARPGN